MTRAAEIVKLAAARNGSELDCESERVVHRGQVRMAYRLADQYADKLLFVPKIGWHAWDGKRWPLDEKGAANRAVTATLRKALADSLGDQELGKDVRRCESAAAIRGILDIASTLEVFVVAADELDADPYLLNTANGTLDLRDMQLRAHNRLFTVDGVEAAGASLAG